MQVVGSLLSTIGWLGLGLIGSLLGATLIYEFGQWLGSRLTGGRVVKIAGYRYQLVHFDGHWRWQRPIHSEPHLVIMPPSESQRFNYAAICFSGGLFNLLTVIFSLVTVQQLAHGFDLWLMIAIIWIWVNTLKALQLLPFVWRGRATAALDFKTARAIPAGTTAAYVTMLATATMVETGSVASLPVDAIQLAPGSTSQNYLIVRQAWVTLQWGQQHGLPLAELLTGLTRLTHSFNELPPADMAVYLDATLYWHLLAEQADVQFIAWIQDHELQRLRQRYTPLTQFKLRAVYQWRVSHQAPTALATIEQGLKWANREHNTTEVMWLKDLQTQIEQAEA